MYLDNTYFQGQLYIPGLQYRSGVGAVLSVVNEGSLDWYIEKYEVEFLIELLGRKLCNEMIEGVKRGDSKMTALRDEIYKVGDFSYSPAANYVYFKTMRDLQSQSSSVGEVNSALKNSFVWYTSMLPHTLSMMSNFALDAISMAYSCRGIVTVGRFIITTRFLLISYTSTASIGATWPSISMACFKALSKSSHAS